MTKNAKVSISHYYIQDIKDVQHKNIKVSWDHLYFPSHPVAAEKFKKEEEILLFRIIITGYIQNLAKVFVPLFGFHVHVQPIYFQLDQYWLQTIASLSQSRFARVENCYYNKILEHYNDCITVEFLDNKTSQVEFDSIHELILSGMSTNKEELVKVNGCGSIAANDEAENNVYIVCFRSVPFTI